MNLEMWLDGESITPMYPQDPEGKAEGIGKTNESPGEILACHTISNVKY